MSRSGISAFQLASIHLRRRPLPVIICVVAIALSTGLNGMLWRLNKLSQSRFSYLASGGDALLGAKSSDVSILLGALNLEVPDAGPAPIPLNIYRTLRERAHIAFEDHKEQDAEGIMQIIPLIYVGQWEKHWMLATDEGFFHRPPRPGDDMPFMEGHAWQDSDQNEAVVGSAVAQDRSLKLQQALTLHGHKFTVVGILQPTHTVWDQVFFINLASAQSLMSADSHTVWGKDVFHFGILYLKPGAWPAVSSLINQRTVAEVVRTAQAKQSLERLTGSARSLSVVFSLIVLALGLLTLIAALTLRYDSMIHQIAVLRAIGYTLKYIGAWLAWDALFIAVAGIMGGAMIDALCFPLFQKALGEVLPPYSIGLENSFGVWITSLLATFAVVVIPVWRLARSDVHQMLQESA